MTEIGIVSAAAPAAVSVPGSFRVANRRFVLPFVRGSAPGEAPATGTASATLAVMLAQQETEDAPARNRDSRRRIKELLALLAELQRALLGGGLGMGLSERLAGLLAELPLAADPALAAILAQTVLRVRIELARATQAREASVSRNESFR